jgi:hypothetical protein
MQSDRTATYTHETQKIRGNELMQTIVVTGSTRGIGHGLAREFLTRGKAIRRFMSPKYGKRDIVGEYEKIYRRRIEQ